MAAPAAAAGAAAAPAAAPAATPGVAGGAAQSGTAAGGTGTPGGGAANGTGGGSAGAQGARARGGLPKGLRKALRHRPDGERKRSRERLERLTKLLLGALGLVLGLLGLLLLPVLMVQALNPFAGGGRYPSGSGIPQIYWHIYTTAATQYKVNPYLLASIHKQESGLSTNPSVRSGVNAAGCCAGPMQFNIRDGSWEPHKYAFRPIEDARPSTYPLDRRTLPSCRGVAADTGCVYDDFDAIAGAAHKLQAGGADTSLYSSGTHRAVCAYIGSCSEVDRCTGSQNEYCQVLPRAIEWELSGGRAGAPATGARAIVEHAVTIAKGFGSDVYVCSDHRPGSITTTGRISDHAFNDARRAARDIAVRGRNCLIGPPSRQLDEAAVAIGAYFGRSYRLGVPIRSDTFHWQGYRIEIIWRTPLWGGHMGHIHIGARKD